MRNVLAFMLLLILVGGHVDAQTTMQWQKTVGGSGDEYIGNVAPTFDGGYIVSGSSRSVDFDALGHHGPASSPDYFIAKLDASGSVVWSKSLGGYGYDVGDKVAQTADSGYIMVGWSESADGDVSFNHGLSDIWVIKLSPTGSIVWEKSYGGTGQDGAYAIQQTVDGGYIIGGYTKSTNGDALGHMAFTRSCWVLKISVSGVIQWKRFMGGTDDEDIEQIRQTADGGYIVMANTYSVDGDITGSHGSAEGWLVKLNDTGAIVWKKCIGGSDADYIFDIRQTTDLGYIAVGLGLSTDGDFSGTHGSWDAIMVKISPSGGTVWKKLIGGINHDGFSSVVQTTDGGYLAVGMSGSTEGDLAATPHLGAGDLWLVKTSSSGIIQWQQRYGGSSTDGDEAYVERRPEGGYIVGTYTSSNDLEVTGSHGVQELWVLKLDNCVLTSPVIVPSAGNLGTSISYSTYQWALGGGPIAGATNDTYTPLINGTYAVAVTDATGCMATSATHFVSNVGFREINNPAALVYPNPLGASPTINTQSKANMKLYNTLGQLLKEEENTDALPLADLPHGIYYIELSDEAHQLLYRGKIVK